MGTTGGVAAGILLNIVDPLLVVSKCSLNSSFLVYFLLVVFTALLKFNFDAILFNMLLGLTGD